MISTVDFPKYCYYAKQFLESNEDECKPKYNEMKTIDSKYRQKIGDFSIMCILFGEDNGYLYSHYSINKRNKVIQNMYKLDVVNVDIDDEFIGKLTELLDADDNQKRDVEAFMAMRKAIGEPMNYDKFILYLYNIIYMQELLKYLSFSKGVYKNVIKEPSLAGESWTTQKVGEYVANITQGGMHLNKHIEKDEYDVYLCFKYGFAWKYQPELTRSEIIHLFKKLVRSNIDSGDDIFQTPDMTDAEYVFYKKHILEE